MRNRRDSASYATLMLAQAAGQTPRTVDEGVAHCDSLSASAALAHDYA